MTTSAGGTFLESAEPGESLFRFADGLWLTSAPVRFLGLRLTATMTVLRTSDGGLLIHSPVRLTDARRAAVQALGPVSHLYAPNLVHHSWIGDWAAAFPSARLHAPGALSRKRPDLRIDRPHGTPLPADLVGIIDEIPIAGCRFAETVLHHRPASTVLVADLVQNVGRPTHRWTASYARAMGFYDRVALSRALRWTAFSDRRAARRSIDELLERQFDHLIVGHGQPIAAEGRAALGQAYRWLRGSGSIA